MMSKLSTRKLAGVLLASALVLSGSIALSASADAAGKQGTACTTLKAKSGSYTCIANPLKSTPKNIWALQNCIDAQTTYAADVANLATYTKNATNAVNQSQSLLASYQNALTVAQTSLDAIMTKNAYTVDYDPATHKPSNQVIGYNAAIAAYQAKLAADQAGLAAAQAALKLDTVGSQKAKNDQATINAYTTGVKYRQQTIDQLNKTVARIQQTITNDQTAITTWTSTVNGAISQQKSLTAQLTSEIATAKSTRASACKTGL
jgi:chromosome segregation ATPase